MWNSHSARQFAWYGKNSKHFVARLSSVLAVVILSAVSGCDNSFKLDLAKGGTVPASVNKIESDVSDWKEVCTLSVADKLHKHRISDLRAAKKPFLVVFGTPQHCTMCVDQLVRVTGLQEKYGERFAFVHSDGYRENPIWVDWGIKGEPWTFIVDGEGKVRELFAGPTDDAVMGAEIEKLLAEGAS